MRTVSYLFAASLLGLAACGGDQAPTNAGSSSGTLLVTANVTASPALGIQNAKTGDQFQTDIAVRVFKVVPGSPNAPVTGATVKVKVGNNTYTIPAGNRAELYHLALNGGFSTDLVTLNVDSGTDFVHNAVRKAPGIQVFSTPQPGDSVSIAGLAGMPYHVTWTRPAAADVTELRFSNFDQQVSDSGAQDVPAANIQQGDAQDVRLRRTNSVQINSAAGSNLEVMIQQDLSINVVP